MRRILTLSSLVFFLTVISAPKAFSQVELFGGYSHLGLSSAPSNIGSSSNGWEGSAYLHLLGPLGIEGDFSNHYGVSPALPADGRTFYVPQFMQLYGPRYTLALPRIHPFVHALLGTVHGVATVPSPTIPFATTTVTENALGLAFGGGINVKATRHIWLRLIQVDYIRSQFPNNGQNETRISAGLVFRFGEW
ncbi:MAG: porin family protein [Acidobacteria bacterium]|nr:porin family protein [Acidobacteriota bacterium]